jgi:hypothetical protein
MQCFVFLYIVALLIKTFFLPRPLRAGCPPASPHRLSDAPKGRGAGRLSCPRPFGAEGGSLRGSHQPKREGAPRSACRGGEGVPSIVNSNTGHHISVQVCRQRTFCHPPGGNHPAVPPLRALGSARSLAFPRAGPQTRVHTVRLASLMPLSDGLPTISTLLCIEIFPLPSSDI